MNASGNWIKNKVTRLLPPTRRSGVSPSELDTGLDPASRQASPPAQSQERPTRERLAARVRRSAEAMSPRMLRRALEDLRAIIEAQISEVEGGRRAQVLLQRYAHATQARRRDIWLLMSELFMADPEKVKTAQAQFAAAVGTPE